MNLDLGTLSGVLGVILTIIFFVVGYRQTIGARKERASAANREIVETLLRRFTLDSDFALQFDEIERFVVGKALDNRVKRSDVYFMDELFPLIYSRVVSSDYVAAKKRKGILDKLGRSFRRSPAEERTFDALVIGRKEKGRGISVEALLGLISALMAAGLSGFADLLVTGWADRLSSPSVRFALGMALGVSTVTAVALVIYVRLRDKTSATKPEPDSSSIKSRAQEFEAYLIARLTALGIPFALERDVDLIISIKQKRIAVELKLYASGNARQMVNQLRSAVDKYHCDEGYLVFSAPPPDKIRALSDERIRVMGADELLGLVTGPEPIRANRNPHSASQA